jgi:hypothetical protein
MATVCLTKATFYGLGRHVQFLDNEERSAVLGLGAVAAVLTIASSVWSKTSFALFLLRISSSGCTEWTRKALIIIIITLNVMPPLALVGFFASCSPIRRNWQLDVEGSCWPPRVKVVLATTVTGESTCGGYPSLERRFGEPGFQAGELVLAKGRVVAVC